jgi:carbon-monoxide dehydrogenase large subunit
MGVKNLGAAVHRIEDARLITGHGRYVDDIKIPGTLSAAFLRSPEAHAKIKSIDLSFARQIPGVVAAYSLADLDPSLQKRMVQAYPNPAIKTDITPYPLAKDEVCFVGEPIAVVIAEDRYIAEDGVQAIQLDLDSLDCVIDAREALKPGAPQVQSSFESNLSASLNWKFGDVDQAFASADHVFKESYFQHRGAPHFMECRGVLAQFDSAVQRLTLWSSTQSPFLVRRYLAAFLEREESSIRVIAPDVGGGFGPKAVHYAEELVVAIATEKLKRPVKWIEDRRENFVGTNQQRDQWWNVEVACKANGKILGIRAECIHDNGAYVPYGLLLPNTSIVPFPGPYSIGAIDVKLHSALTNAVPTTPIRGAGRPNAIFVLERSIDTIARELNLDRAEVRRTNFVRKDQFPYETGAKLPSGVSIQYDSGDYHKTLEMALQASKAEEFEVRRKKAAQTGKWLGLGIASYNEDSGLPPYEGATVKILPTGRVLVEVGSCAQGQGLETIVAQIAADYFGVQTHDVLVRTGDTDFAALALSTVGSRVAATVGPSVHLAAQQVREKALKLAAKDFEASVNDLEIVEGRVGIKGVPGKSVGLGDLSRRLVANVNLPVPSGFSPGLEATAYHTTERPVYANGTNACEVEVDIESGEVRLLNYWVAHDCGTIINPRLVDGQIIGGVVHGIGNALFEHMKYDRESGQPLCNNLGEYLLPLATEMPQIHCEHMESPSPVNPLGIKGAGEGGTIPGIACIISGIEDALRPLCIKINEYPLSPERLLELIDEKRQQRAS